MAQGSLSILAFLMAAAATASAQFVIGRGSCPNTGAISTFDKSQYVGTWYEYERFPNWFEAGMKCVTAQYGDNGDGTISVTNAGIIELKLFGRVIFRRDNSIDGTATVPDPAKPGELKVSFSSFDMGGDQPNYFVVDTDYNNYAVVFSCFQLPGIPLNIQFAWILTRVPGQAPANIRDLKASLRNAGVNVRRFNTVDQSNCS